MPLLANIQKLAGFPPSQVFTMQETKHTRSMFLTRALERILADKELRRSQNAQLKKACQLAIGKFKTFEYIEKFLYKFW